MSTLNKASPVNDKGTRIVVFAYTYYCLRVSYYCYDHWTIEGSNCVTPSSHEKRHKGNRTR